MDERTPLIEKLEAYGRTDVYPFHMPGHKRQAEMGITSFPNPFSVDITEIDGFDNLHHPENILKESMEYAAKIYGSDKTYYLVNGSTCGILSALGAAAKTGSRIAMARNSHKAAYHAVLLNHLNPVYLWPEVIPGCNIQGGIKPEDVEQVLTKYPDLAAVYITSPTYEGIVSDVESIAKLCHGRGLPLIVDEAHGAHFSFGGQSGGRFPKSALDCGADAVVQSLHKTLPSLTQTAVLHVKSRLLKCEEVERRLRIFESSSPSYVLLSSIENCILYMEKEGKIRLDSHGRKLQQWMQDCGKLKNLSFLTDEVKGRFGIKDRDISKIVVFDRSKTVTGIELQSVLRERYRLEPEMACCRYVLLMTSLMDTDEGLARLKEALFEIDSAIDSRSGRERPGEPRPEEPRLEEPWPGELRPEELRPGESLAEEMLLYRAGGPERCAGIFESAAGPLESIDLMDGAGRVSGDFITVYPPGIPAFTPGERLTKEDVAAIQGCIRAGLTVEGPDEAQKIRVLRE